MNGICKLFSDLGQTDKSEGMVKLIRGEVELIDVKRLEQLHNT